MRHCLPAHQGTWGALPRLLSAIAAVNWLLKARPAARRAQGRSMGDGLLQA